MSNFTDTELEDAVSQYIRNEVKTEREDLGPLNVDHTFTEVREFVASTLVYDPSAVFYLLSLAANRVNQDVIQALEYLEDIQTAILEMGRYTTKVTQTSLLEDAAAALLEVDRVLLDKNAIAERGLARYRSSLEKFTDASLTPNIRSEVSGGSFPNTYEIVRPPQKAQAAIKEQIANLRDIHTTLIEEAQQLSESMDEFMDQNLPLTAIQTSVGKVRTDLRALKSEFDAAETDDDSISLARDAYLRIAAGESVMNNLSSITDPREPRMQALTTTSDRAQAAYGSDSEGTEAEVETTVSAPWPLTSSANQIILNINGAGSVTITLPVDTIANIQCYNGENYDIHDEQKANLTSSSSGPYTVPAAPNNVFDVYVDGIGFRVTLTPGAITTAALAAAINGATRIDGGAGTFGAVATASDSSGALKLEHDTAGDGDLVIGEQDTLNTALGFTSGQDSDDLAATRGVVANNKIKFLVDDDTEVEATLTTGAARTAAQVATDIAGASSTIDASAVDQDVLPSGTQKVVEVSSTSSSGSAITPYPTTVVHEEAMKTLGFYEVQSDRAGYTDLQEVIDAIEDATSLVELEKSETTVQTGTAGKARKVGALYYLDVGPVGTLNGPAVLDSIQIELGANVGWYRVVGVTTLDGGTRDALQVERAFPTTTGSQAENQKWGVYQRYVTIKTVSANLSSKIEVLSASANSILGLTVGTYYGYVSGVKVLDAGKEQSFDRNDVKANDWLTFGGGGSTTTHQVVDVTEDGYQLEVTPQVRNDRVGELYKIESEGDVAYESFIDELETWIEALEESNFSEDVLYLERVLNPLLTNKNPSNELINNAKNAAQDLYDLYSSSNPGLKEILEGFTVTAVERIDALLDMLIERGLERAHDLLLLGRFDDFFGATKDGASYGGAMLESMRSIVQEDLPISKEESEDHVDSRLTGSAEEPDADLDFSDQDDETGITETDDIPEPDEEDDFLNETI